MRSCTLGGNDPKGQQRPPGRKLIKMEESRGWSPGILSRSCWRCRLRWGSSNRSQFASRQCSPGWACAQELDGEEKTDLRKNNCKGKKQQIETKSEEKPGKMPLKVLSFHWLTSGVFWACVQIWHWRKGKGSLASWRGLRASYSKKSETKKGGRGSLSAPA